MRDQISFEIAHGAMSLIADGTSSADFNTFGLSEDEYYMFVGEKHWLQPNRSTIERVASVLVFGIMDVMGVQRFEVSAEYMAAIIGVFVSGSNIMAACSWLPPSAANADIIEGNDGLGVEYVTPKQLFALVLKLREKPNSEFRHRFEARTGLIKEKVGQNA